MERVVAFSKHCERSDVDPGIETIRERRTQRTSITGILAFGACAVVWTPTNATHIIVRHVPPPSSNGIPLLDSHFHVDRCEVGFGSVAGTWNEEVSVSWAAVMKGTRSSKIKTRSHVMVIGPERARG